jgi:hypothetical protein
MVGKRTNEDDRVRNIVVMNAGGRWLDVMGGPVPTVAELDLALKEQK